MNIIALSLGLAPIPPLPPDVRLRRAAKEQADAARRAERAQRLTGLALDDDIRQLICDTGSASTNELVNYYGHTRWTIKQSLARLCQRGVIKSVTHAQSKRWHLIEEGAA